MCKLAIFVDVQNIFYTTRDQYGRAFNYRYFWQQIESQGDIVMATAYAIHRGDDKQFKFQQALKHIGFELKLKPFIQRREGSAKGDWDVGITLDVMTAAPAVDKVILLSGDGDFDLLLARIKRDYQVQTQVFGVPQLPAASLIEVADEFQPIDQAWLLPN